MTDPRMNSARLARLRAELPLPQAASAVRVSPAYLAQLERTGDFPYHLAQRLSRLYRCPVEVFLPTRGDRTPKRAGDGGSRTSRPLTEAVVGGSACKPE